MSKFINIHPFIQGLFDEEGTARRAAEIGQGILVVRSLRLTDIAVAMRGNSTASNKRTQRFTKEADPRQSLWRLFQEQAEFVIGDPTEIERPQAWKTGYVGAIKDGKTKEFWALLLATPLSGACETLWIDHLLIKNDCQEPRFAQSKPFSGLRRAQRPSGGAFFGAGSGV